MTKILFSLAAAVLLGCAVVTAAETTTNLTEQPIVAADDPLPNVTAHSAIVIEASTGQLIYARAADERRYPASTTKMMTLITALEDGNLSDTVTVSSYAAETDGSTLWLEKGDKIPLKDLLYGLIMMSGNDAAVAVAEHIGGTEAIFSRRMTEKAHSIGAKDTNFVNPHGLPDERHFSTARDLAKIAAYGYRNPQFTAIVGQKELTLPWIKDPAHFWRNENQILWLYDGANGVKTGYTDLAGRCLVAGAKQNGVQLVTVVLDSMYMWNDTIALLDFGFKHIKKHKFVSVGEKIGKVSVVSGWRKEINAIAKDNLVVPLADGVEAENFERKVELPVFLKAPVVKGDKVGELTFYYGDEKIATTDLVADVSVERKSFFLTLRKFLKGLLT